MKANLNLLVIKFPLLMGGERKEQNRTNMAKE
jgi:hypothetical protein